VGTLPELPWLSRVAGRYVLPVWFAIWSTVYVVGFTRDGTWAFDARIYYRAASLWVSGGDPWSASASTTQGGVYHFAGLPPTVLAYAPFTILPEDVFAIGMSVTSWFAAIFLVRRLRLAWWWLLFPPLVLGVGSANPGVLLVALLVWGNPLAEAVAAALKVYAVVPMVGNLRWRGLAAAALFAVLSGVFFPGLWRAYGEQGASVAGRLIGEAGGGAGATAYWWLIPPTVAAVAIIAWRNRSAAGWLAVPGVWPSGQFHYAVTALPVMRLWPAALFAMPVYGMPAVAVILHAWLMIRDDVRRDQRLEADPPNGAPPP
jgi:hypothetical protein